MPRSLLFNLKFASIAIKIVYRNLEITMSAPIIYQSCKSKLTAGLGAHFPSFPEGFCQGADTPDTQEQENLPQSQLRQQDHGPAHHASSFEDYAKYETRGGTRGSDTREPN